VPALELQERALRLQTGLRNARFSRVAARIESAGELVTVLLACRPLAIELIIVSPWLPREVTDALYPDCWVQPKQRATPAVVGADNRRISQGAGRRVPGITLFSSGTTGVPKAAHWAWESFDQPQSVATHPERWGIGYAPFTFAAVSATCQALSRARALEYVQPASFAHAIPGEPFDVLAGTPSFWRMAAITARRAGGRPRPVQVATIGGEPVDQALLGLVRSVFAPARIKQIFGTTELGLVMSVDDELPGLPLSLAGKRMPNGAAFDVRGEMLRISAHPEEPFLETGDMVRVASGRVHVMGRAGRTVNVGGHKVDPLYVSQVINQNPEVMGARAYPVASPLLGNVIGVDVVPRHKCDPGEFAAKIKSYAKLHLAPAERPQRVRVTDQLPLAPSGKMSFDE
jgi:acyl-coenzyme A synthetase/AMP-(fatty) acid ligase